MSVEPVASYDPIANPYAPGAGTPPPALVGRDQAIEDADVAFQRVLAGRSTQHLMLTGLRGVGKTVLLGKLSALAEHRGLDVIRLEAVGGDDTVRTLVRQARRVVEGFDRSSKVARALRSIDSVSLTVLGSGFEIGRVGAAPDSDALADMIIDLAAAARAQVGQRPVGVLLAIDEAQLLDPHQLRRILAGVHRCGQDALPLACLLAGLPNLVGQVARAATYAERMFRVAELGPLSPTQVTDAVIAPSADLGVAWSEEAIASVADRSDGFPFFVQTWAYHTWNSATDDPISAADVARAAAAAERTLDAAFFAARIARIPASEVAYVQALASLGPGPHRSGEVAAAAGRTTSQVAAFRDRLIDEGVVYAPRYGWVEFAIPHFDEYVRRTLTAT